MSPDATEGAQQTGPSPAEPGKPEPAGAGTPPPDPVPAEAGEPGPGTGTPPEDPGDDDLAAEDPVGEDLDPGTGFPPERPTVSKLAALALVAGVLVVAGGAVGTVAALTHGFRNPLKPVYHEAAVFRLRPGECIDIPNGSSPAVVSCTVPHDAEVFGTFTLPGSAWPGTAAVRREASAGCGSRLTQYLNPQLAISLAQAYVYPSRVDWNAGTKTVVCEVRAASGQLTQSVRGGASPRGS